MLAMYLTSQYKVEDTLILIGLLLSLVCGSSRDGVTRHNVGLTSMT